MADYTIKHHFPHIENMSTSESSSISTGEEQSSDVDLASNKYAGEYFNFEFDLWHNVACLSMYWDPFLIGLADHADVWWIDTFLLICAKM